jgi:type IV pilus assembly protein PilQ
VNWDLKRYGLVVGTAAMVSMVQPAHAAQTEIVGVQLMPAGNGFELLLKTQGNNRPPIFTVNRGNTSVADISNAQLRLPSGSTFNQPNPAAGIAGIEIKQLDSNTVRITVQGTNAAPVSDTIRRDEKQGILQLKFAASGVNGAPGQAPASVGQAPNAVPPVLKRPQAPPVGDMAVGGIDAAPDTIELGNNQIIPKLLLRNAPVREVLTLLGRAAGTNVAFAEEEGGADPAGGAGAAPSGATVSLDIENESVQDVFNYVLRLTGLQANKVGQTVFVGKTLPGDAQNRIVRTIRLNQLRATGKNKFVNGLATTSIVGGSTSGGQGSVTAGGDSTTASISGSGASASLSSLGRTSSFSESYEEKGAKEILESYGANEGVQSNQESSAPTSDLLKGLQVVADARANTVTLIGSPRKIGIATDLLKQLDIRKRQAMVKVQIVDVNLLKTKTIDPRFQIKAGNSVGFSFAPSGNDPNAPSSFGTNFGSVSQAIFPGTALANVASGFLASLFASVGTGNSKVLASPNLIIQEGSSAQVNLTEEVFSGFESTSTESAAASGGSTAATSVKTIIKQAGVILNVTVDRIDDNGFLTLSVSPEVSAPFGEFDFVFPGSNARQTGTLLSQRRLETGKIRLRDGQTLVLSGIIRDTDRQTISKVPILGDIPLLGRLFRRESGRKERTELFVIVTPQVMDDSDQSTVGYQYVPSPEAQKLLNK